MKKLIAFSALSLAIASVHAAQCPVGQACNYEIGSFNTHPSIWFTELQPGHIYLCDFTTLYGMATSISKPRATPGVDVVYDHAHNYLPAVVIADTRGAPDNQLSSFALEFDVHGLSKAYRYTLRTYCYLQK